MLMIPNLLWKLYNKTIVVIVLMASLMRGILALTVTKSRTLPDPFLCYSLQCEILRPGCRNDFKILHLIKQPTDSSVREQ